MSTADERPFKRDEQLDEPGIVGARWWQQNLAQVDPVSRRRALQGILAVGGVVLGVGALAAMIANAASSDNGTADWRQESRAALAMQEAYGWNFGVPTEGLTFNGASTQPFDRSRLAAMPDDLGPASARLRPYYVPTLFQSPAAVPTSKLDGEADIPVALQTALVPIFTPEMQLAYRAGQRLAWLLAGRTDVAVIVDMAGSEGVALAAGASMAFDVVFTFDNWPHPRGVVAAHRTLAAAAYYQPLFAKRPKGGSAPPLFALDSARLTAYTDDATQFDNRHVARLPAAADMKALGVAHVLYVSHFVPIVLELDDLNDDFVAFVRAGLDLRALEVQTLDQSADAGVVAAIVDGGGGAKSNDAGVTAKAVDAGSVAKAHPEVADGGGAAASSAVVAPLLLGAPYPARPRVTIFSSGVAGGSRPTPAGFGTVPVIVAVAGGILGAKLNRSGSWNRAPSTSSWGGG